MKYKWNVSGKKIAGIMAIALVLGIAAQYMEQKESILQKNHLIQSEPGEGSVQANLSYREEDGQKENYVIEVPERQLSESEWKEQLAAAEKELEKLFLGENEDLQHISGRVNLCQSLNNGLFSVQWELNPDDCIDPEGQLLEEALEDGQLIMATATIRYQNYEAVYEFPFVVYKQPLTEEAAFDQAVRAYLENQDMTKGEIELPTSVGGKRLIWFSQKSHIWAVFLLLGAFAAAAVPAGQYAEEEKRKRKQQRELVSDYPEIVSQLSLLLTSGMSLKQAWHRIFENYETKRARSHSKERAGYEQIRIMVHEMQDGVTQTRAYELLGERCGLSQYRRLASLLSQNLMKGTAGIAKLLEKEAEQAFQERKNTAQRMGEEAGTKLLFPMMLMLVVVMVILIVPACMSMNL
ncbi:MAG: type II secretion system F family protein [Lachnospiraceae bacterium]|nr:type II secretion system F family protein [Lachnospiraceae bacterium]